MVRCTHVYNSLRNYLMHNENGFLTLKNEENFLKKQNFKRKTQSILKNKWMEFLKREKILCIDKPD